MSIVMHHWIADERVRVHKVKAIDGKAVSIAIDGKFYLLFGKEQEYYNKVLNQHKGEVTQCQCNK